MSLATFSTPVGTAKLRNATSSCAKRQCQSPLSQHGLRRRPGELLRIGFLLIERFRRASAIDQFYASLKLIQSRFADTVYTNLLFLGAIDS